MPHFTVKARLSRSSSGRERTVGLLTILPSDPSLTLTYWRPGADGYRSPGSHLSLDAVEGMVFHCSAWKDERRVAKFSIHLDWRGVWYERTWHAKITVTLESSKEEAWTKFLNSLLN